MGELSDETAGVSPRLASPRSSTRYRCQLFYPGHALILALGHDVGGAELTSWSLVSRLTVWYACSVCIVALVPDTLFYEGLLRLGLLTVVPGAVLLIYVGNRMTQRGLQPLIQMTEMMQLAQRLLGALQNLYRPEGFNIGMNLGQAAGAGIREHFHLHVVPRWTGDSNFTTVVGETRVLPEELSRTYERLKSVL